MSWFSIGHEGGKDETFTQVRRRVKDTCDLAKGLPALARKAAVRDRLPGRSGKAHLLRHWDGKGVLTAYDHPFLPQPGLPALSTGQRALTDPGAWARRRHHLRVASRRAWRPETARFHLPIGVFAVADSHPITKGAVLRTACSARTLSAICP